jgi:hypothetical protein
MNDDELAIRRNASKHDILNKKNTLAALEDRVRNFEQRLDAVEAWMAAESQSFEEHRDIMAEDYGSWLNDGN